MSSRISVTRNLDLVKSPDDNGWYFQRLTDWRTSQLFPTHEEATKAYLAGALKWEVK